VKKAGRSVEKREPGGKTEKEAEKKLTQRLNERAAAAIGARPFTGPESERVTIEDLLCSLEAQYRIEKREEKKSHSHMVPLRDFFGVQKAFEVTADRVREYIAHRRRAGKADGTIARELHILRRAYSLAVEDKKLFPYQVPTMPALSDDNVREGFVEKGDFDRIVAYLQQQDPDVADFVLWGFWTGMRKGEITKLTWAAVDKDLTALILPRRSAKTKTSRKLILQGVYREIIVRRARARRPGCDFIFHREGAGHGELPQALEDRMHGGEGLRPPVPRSSTECSPQHDPSGHREDRRQENLWSQDGCCPGTLQHHGRWGLGGGAAEDGRLYLRAAGDAEGCPSEAGRMKMRTETRTISTLTRENVVSRLGLEPRALALKGRCSTD